MAPTSGFGRPVKVDGVDGPSSQPYTIPVAAIMITAAAVLNTERCSGSGCLAL
jgi:hypothetical protein